MSVRVPTERHDRRSAYGIGRTTLAVAGAIALIAINIALMMVIAPTAAADLVIWSYEAAPFSPWPGFIIMSALLSVGRLVSYTSLGYDAFDPEDTAFVGDINPKLAVAGVITTMLAFGLFGGAALSIVPPEYRVTVVAISVAITAAVAFLVGGLELITERTLAPHGRLLMAGGMGIGIAALVVGYVFDTLGAPFAEWIYLAAFAFIVLGWLGDLVHEICVLTRDDRPVLVNSYGLYAAVTGFLVHIIWIVARAYAEEN